VVELAPPRSCPGLLPAPPSLGVTLVEPPLLGVALDEPPLLVVTLDEPAFAVESLVAPPVVSVLASSEESEPQPKAKPRLRHDTAMTDLSRSEPNIVSSFQIN
jgi:hypothetical protein